MTDETPLGGHPLDLARIRADSLFSLPVIDGILASTGARLRPACPIRAPDGVLEVGLPSDVAWEIARYHVAMLSPMFVALYAPRRATAEQLQKAISDARRLSASLNALRSAGEFILAPQIKQIATLQLHLERKLSALDRLPAQDDLFLFPPLIAAFCAIYCTRPGRSDAGPTIRFMAAVLAAAERQHAASTPATANPKRPRRSAQGGALKKRVETVGGDQLVSMALEPALERNAAILQALQARRSLQ